MEEKKTPPIPGNAAPEPSLPDEPGRQLPAAEEQGQSILADIAFYLITAGSALAGSFTYQMEARFQDESAADGDALRKRALKRIHGLLLDELCDSIEREPAVRRFALSREEIRVLSEQFLEKEILEEKFDGNTYFLKARLVADPARYADSAVALSRLEYKARELQAAKDRLDRVRTDVRRLEGEVRLARLSREVVKALAPPGGVPSVEAPHQDAGEPLAVSGDKGKPPPAEETAKREPGEAAPYIEMGAAHFDLGRFEEAIKDFTRAFELDPQNARALCARGSALVSLARFNEAVEDFSRAIKLKEDMAEAYFNRAVVSLIYKNDPEKAIGDLGEVIGLTPGDSVAYLCRGAAYERLGRHGESISNFSKAAQLDRNDAAPLFNRANAYLRSGDTRQAIADYSEALRRDPRHTRALFNRAFAYARHNRFENAVEDFTRVLGLDPADAKAFLYRGHASYRLGRIQDALADWQVAARCGEETANKLLAEVRA